MGRISGPACLAIGLPGTTACCEDGEVTYAAWGWAFIGVGALVATATSFSLLASREPQRAAQRGGAGQHKQTGAGITVARSDLWWRLGWSLPIMSTGLLLVTYAFWARAVTFVLLTVIAAAWLSSLIRRRRQNRPSENGSL